MVKTIFFGSVHITFVTNLCGRRTEHGDGSISQQVKITVEVVILKAMLWGQGIQANRLKPTITSNNLTSMQTQSSSYKACLRYYADTTPDDSGEAAVDVHLAIL
jgi:hypothetical protein